MAHGVLLIDDNAVQAATRQTILRRAGHFVIAVLNPRRALEQIQGDELPVPIGLIITDHIMPEMTGAEFVRELRRTHPQMPVLVISGLDEAEAEYEGLNITFHLKPVLPDRLIASVQAMLESSRSEAQVEG